ncbi:thermonuclease family protein [Cellvibrio sp. pealriver]|uniref:thermonuclease family protein n=1 Tax=Cellvibrio sp. pealriver TaxID=1622269 RepID=UPI001E4A88FA|nr:thermonuclease family protein [Cellvibrio sp. pealriver]
MSDGDTLKLHDGRSVRVLGINAPEIAHGAVKGQPFGRESKAHAQMFVDETKGRIRLGFEREIKDRYGRLLAHVYDSQNRSLAAEQLRAGMALQIAVPPNYSQMDCLRPLENSAREKKLGLWRSSYWQPVQITSLQETEAGFRHVRGRITKVSMNTAIWLEFDGQLVAKIAKKDWPLFMGKLAGVYKKADWLSLKGKEVELRGWITRRKSNPARQYKPLILHVRVPSSMRVVDR